MTYPITNNPIQFALAGPVSQTTTASYVAVSGSLIDLAQAPSGIAAYTVKETGGVNSVNFKIQASNDQTNWCDVSVQFVSNAGATGIAVSNQLTAGTAQFVSQCASIDEQSGFPVTIPWPGRYLQVVVEDATSGSHGTVLVTGFAH